MTNNTNYLNAKDAHRKLLLFATDSREEITVNNQTITVYHTQFGTYDIRDALKTLAENTEKSPADSREFKDEAKEAIKDSNAFVERQKRDFYQKREYLTGRDLRNAASEYHIASSMGEDEVYFARPSRETRLQEIADILTYYHASTAESSWNNDFLMSDIGDGLPNDDADSELLMGALLAVRDRLHGKELYSRPDPSLHTVRVLTTLYEESGLSPSVRDLYGILVSDVSAEMYEPDDAKSQEIMSKMSRTISRAAGMNIPDETETWISEDEPPIETLQSYTQS